MVRTCQPAESRNPGERRHIYNDGMGLRGVIVVLAACSSPPHVKPDAAPPRDGPLAPPFTQQFSSDLDILFVIDNSPSTADKQTLFATNFPNFISALDTFPTGRPNLHLGVVSTTVDIGVQGFGPGCPSPDPNDNGLMQNLPRVAGCTPPSGRFISDIKNSTGGRTTNYSGTLQDTFSCIAQLGATGCGFEAQLESMKRALDGSRTENAGFIRTDANLVVVFLTDEDDCSAQDVSIFGLGAASAGPGDFRCQPLYAYTCDTPISVSSPGSYTNCVPRSGSYLQDIAYYTQFLASVKGGQRIAIAMVMGDRKPVDSHGVDITTGPISTPITQTLALQPSCTATINGQTAIGRPGIRLGAFVDAFGAQGRTYTVCQSDYSAALADMGQLMLAMANPCISGAIDATDTDPANPGVQPACSVTVASQTLPSCKMADPTTPSTNNPQPCAYFVADATCGTPTNLAVRTTLGTASFGTEGVTVTCP
jgi:hypothetical protein